MFAERERDIFGPYWDGVKNVFGDPMAIYRKFRHELGEEPNKVFADAHSDIEQIRFEARNKVVQAVMTAFNMVPFNSDDGTGAKERDCNRVLADFIDWIEKKNLNSDEPQISSPGSDGRRPPGFDSKIGRATW